MKELIVTLNQGGFMPNKRIIKKLFNLVKFLNKVGIYVRYN